MVTWVKVILKAMILTGGLTSMSSFFMILRPRSVDFTDGGFFSSLFYAGGWSKIKK